MKITSIGAKEERYRLVILTDMENEPDDSQTMVKLLMYSNEVDIEGLISVTSRWLKHDVFPESIVDRVEAYAVVRKNLVKHATGWPTREYLLKRTAGGQRGYGMQAVGDGKNTEGSDLIIRAVDADDPRPVHVAINAGANTLAQALWDVKAKRTEQEVEKFIQKIRVYDDSGQDDAGAWICHTFPEIFYLRSRVQVFGLFGPDCTSGPQPWLPLDQYDWAEQNVRTRHGILGALFPQRVFKERLYEFMDGGGTTSWLGLVNKGLYDPSKITWGGWGGRFEAERKQVPAGQQGVYLEEEKYEPFDMYPEASDYSWKWEGEQQEWNAFSGVNGPTKYYVHNFAPLWRWRNAYTNDFKARMDWCVTDYAHANHAPVAAFYDDFERTIVRVEAEAGEHLSLDASKSFDPDGDALIFHWFAYPEAGTYRGDIVLKDDDKASAELTIPKDASGTELHVVLELTDDHADAPMTSYRRIVIQVK